MRTMNKVLLNFGNGSTGFISDPIDTSQLFAVSVQFAGAAGFQGTLKLYGSNEAENPFWFSEIASIPITGAANNMIPTTSICYQWVQVEWIRTAGFGILGIIINGQGA